MKMTTDIDRGPIVEQMDIEKPKDVNSSAHYKHEAIKSGYQELEKYEF